MTDKVTPPRIPTRPLCARCHRYITIDVDADDDLWAEVIGPLQGPGYICANCFTQAADERLIAWEGRLRFMAYSLAAQRRIQAGEEVKCTTFGHIASQESNLLPGDVVANVSCYQGDNVPQMIEITYADGERLVLRAIGRFAPRDRRILESLKR